MTSKILYKGEPLTEFSRTTRWRIKKRGYYYAPRKKKVLPLPNYPEWFESHEVIRFAQKLVSKHFGFSHPLYNDMVGEVLLRWCMHSGISHHPKYLATMARYAMLDTIKHWEKGSTNYEYPVPSLLDYLEVSPENAQLWGTLYLKLIESERIQLEKFLAGRIMDLPARLKKKIISILKEEVSKDEKDEKQIW